ncbi:Calx-beta domain-containing protein [Roseomonas sp. F4]
MALLINGFGGPAGFGENALPADSRWSLLPIDLSAFFNASSGLKFLGNFYSALWVNQDGFIQFRPDSGDRAELPDIPSQGPGVGTRETIAPILAPFWSPVDTDQTPLPPSEGGTSRGTNLVWYHLDEATGTLVVTWDDVLPTSGGGSEIDDAEGRNAFQLVLRPATNPGATSIDFDVTFRYESLEWPSFNFRDNTAFETMAGRAVMTDFATVLDGEVIITELPPSLAAAEDPDAALDLVTTGNIIGQPGVWHFAYRQGWVTAEISATDAVVVEGTGPGATFAAVEVSLVAGVDHSVTVYWEAMELGGGLGFAEIDYDLLQLTGSITFAPGETQKSIFIPIVRDAIDEDLPEFGITGETFQVILSTTPVTFLEPGGSVLLTESVVVTILDDDLGDPPGFSVFDATARERDPERELVFIVTREDTSTAGSVDYSVAGNTATAGQDFTATSGTLIFAPGQATEAIYVAITDDNLVEPNETLTVTLSNPVGQPILQGSATGTIVSDDSGLVIQPDPSFVLEGEEDTAVTFRFTRSGADVAVIRTLNWVFETEGLSLADFAPGTAFSGTVSFTAGQTEQSVTLFLLADDVTETVLEAGRMTLIPADAARYVSFDSFDFSTQDAPDPATNDRRLGTSGADTISGLAGNDTLLGLGGDDLLRGGRGDDRLVGGDGRDTLEGGFGRDRLLGEAGDDSLSGGAGDDLISGGLGADTLSGDAGNDTLAGGDGGDVLFGGADRDRLMGDAGDDSLDGGDGDDRLFGGDDQDTLAGGDGADYLLGEAGADLLLGGAGEDQLRGGAGDDTLEGGLGADRLRGDAGRDVFRWTSLDESTLATRDRVLDFVVGEDRLDFSAIDGDLALPGIQEFILLGSGGFMPGTPGLRFVHHLGNTVIQLDSADPDLVPEMYVVLAGLHELTAAEFILS